MKKSKGITLVTLIITIIILLILSTITLIVFNNYNIINYSKNIILIYDKSAFEEKVKIALLNATLTGYGTLNTDLVKINLDKSFEKDKYTLIELKKDKLWIMKYESYDIIFTETGNIIDYGNIEDLKPIATTAPWIPNGFYQIDGTNLDTGLVITNDIDNYVWVEVPFTTSATILRDNKETIVSLIEARNSTEIEEILKIYVGSYNNTNYSDIWFDSQGNNASNSTNLDDTTGCGMTYEQYTNTYNTMLESIQKHGGFWISQYEAGIPYEQENETPTHREKDDPHTTMVFSKNNYVYNNLYCHEAQNLSNKKSTSDYTCSLLFGIQWDLVCKFIDEKTTLDYQNIAVTSESWGNFKDTLWTSSENSRYSNTAGVSYINQIFNKTTNEKILLTTGALERTTTTDDASPMNIYDFAGNVWEYTLEYYHGNPLKPVTIRGGNYINSQYAAATRYNGKSTAIGNNAGFRSTLY